MALVWRLALIELLAVVGLSLALGDEPPGNNNADAHNDVDANNVDEPSALTGGQFDLGFEMSFVNKAAAANAGVGTPDPGFDFALRLYFWRYLAVGAGGGLGGTSDKKSFSENTTGGERESSLLLHHWWIAPGVVSPFLALPFLTDECAANVGLYAGFDGQFGSRSIDNCQGCSSENIQLNNSVFAEGVLSVAFTDYIGAALRYRRRLGAGDIESRAGVDVFFGNPRPH